MKLTFNVELEDGTKHRVQTAYADIIAMEDEFDIDASDLVTRQKGKWLAYLAWHALKRRKVLDMSWDQFRNQVESVDAEGGESEEGTPQGNA